MTGRTPGRIIRWRRRIYYGWALFTDHCTIDRGNPGYVFHRARGDWRRVLGAKPRPDRDRHARAPASVAVRSRRGAGADGPRPLYDRQSHRIV